MPRKEQKRPFNRSLIGSGALNRLPGPETTDSGKEKAMKKKTVTTFVLAALCLLLALSAAAAETREGVIWLEGMEEPVEETLFESPQGFAFWYVNDRLKAEHGEANSIEGAVVAALYADDYMVLSAITREEAEEYIEDLDGSIAEQSAAARVETELYHELADGQYYFCTLIAENGQYLRAVGQYSQEAAEGTAKFFRRVLDSVTFAQPDGEADRSASGN